MRWGRGRGGDAVEDRRGRPGGRAALPVGGGLAGLITVVLVLLLGGGGYAVESPFEQFPAQEPPGDARAVPGAPDPEEEIVDFVSFVIGDLQRFWEQDFGRAGRAYQPTRLVLFREATDTGCGTGSAATGPFYCPLDPPDLHRPRVLPRPRDALPGPG